MSAQHTPGRLLAERIPATFNPKMDGFQLVGVTPEGNDLMTVALCTVNEADEANARRLVACWNACEGISDENLDRLDGHWGQGYVKERDARARAERQRDDLLAALRMVMACAGDISAAPDGLLEMALDDGDEETRRQANAFLVARAAIAKVTGEQT